MKYYGTADEAVSEPGARRWAAEKIQFGDGPSRSARADGGKGDAPIIKMVSHDAARGPQACARRDIHLEPLEKRFRVRFRIDGVLHEMQNPPKKLQTRDHLAV